MISVKRKRLMLRGEMAPVVSTAEDDAKGAVGSEGKGRRRRTYHLLLPSATPYFRTRALIRWLSIRRHSKVLTSSLITSSLDEERI